MKNLKRKFVFALLVTVIALLTAGVFAPRAEAEVKVTVKNNRSHTISIAFCWANFDDDTSKGWYNVKAGETRTITFKDVEYALTAQDFGFYAKAGKTVWSGKESDDRPNKFWIHPTKSFTGNNWSESDISGGQMVYFRPMNLKATGDSRTDATATLTFNE